MAVFCIVDDKHVPLYRVMWIAVTPHFCGSPKCEHEGDYEVRLEQGESVWATHDERDALLAAIEDWQQTIDPDHEDDWN